MFVSTNSRRLCVTTCGLCKVAVWSTTSTPRLACETTSASTIEPVLVVYGDGCTSKPRTSCAESLSVRTSPSPRCPALPVTRIFIVSRLADGGELARRLRPWRRRRECVRDLLWLGDHLPHVEMLLAHEPLRDRVLQELDQRREVVARVQQDDRVQVEPQALQRQCLEQLFERSASAGKRDEPMALRQHQMLA